MGTPPSRGELRLSRLLLKRTKQLSKRYRLRVSPEKLAQVKEAEEQLQSKLTNKSPIKAELEALEAALVGAFGPFLKTPLRESTESIVIALLLALCLRAFFFEAFTIPSGSMIPTLAVGDFIFINKLAYGVWNPFTGEQMSSWSLPERGDVIVFSYPCDRSMDYIKRVVGRPGDIVDVDNYGFLTLNGAPISERSVEPFRAFDDFRGEEQGSVCGSRVHLFEKRVPLPEGETRTFNTLHCMNERPGAWQSERAPWDWGAGPYQRCNQSPLPPHPLPWRVPDDHLFVMGDNRPSSADSRFWGFVPQRLIKGRASFIWLSLNYAESFLNPLKWIRWGRLFTGLHQARPRGTEK
ncbi:MAG: signal peptidase I [Myxococcota bacterium]|nr:signal peptidase I [Myxococcota bacterium]